MPFYGTKEYKFKTTGVNEIVDNLLSKFINSNTFKNNLENLSKMTFVGIGQAGGRMVAPAYSLGFPTYAINSSQEDFKELASYNIPEQNLLFTGVYDKDNNVINTMQGTSKNRQKGLDIAALNIDVYEKLAKSDEIIGADFVWVAASLGGGTGSGAVLSAAFEIVKAREAHNIEQKGTIDENSVGLILSLPSEKDAGIAYRENALQALQELRETIEQAKLDYKDGYESIGAIYLIDNQHFVDSDFYKDYKQDLPTGFKASAHQLSNAYTIASIFEFMSFLALTGDQSVDRNELSKLLGTTGFLNIKRIESDETIENDLEKYKSDSSSTAIEAVSEIIKNYAKKFNNMQDIQLDMSNMESNEVGICYAIVNKDNFSVDHATEIVNEILKDKKILHSNPGVYSMDKQVGITLFLGYVSKSFPLKAYERLSAEYQTYEKIEKEIADRQAQANEQLDNQLSRFNIRDTNRRSLFVGPDNTRDNDNGRSSRGLKAHAANTNTRFGGNRRQGGLQSSVDTRFGRNR